MKECGNELQNENFFLQYLEIFILVEFDFGDVGFCGGGNTGEPCEKPSD